MGWPEYAYLTLLFLGLGMTLAEDGKPKEGYNSFPLSAATAALVLWLLWCGGFFR
jgi:hypothetical protein